jgi:DNA-directed RNA polymerase subunit alpha
MLEYGQEEIHEATLEDVPIPAASVKPVEVGDTYGLFSVEPLDSGYGTTLGNSLRRVLLSSVTGTAVTWVRIEGVEHEYSTIPYVKEDVVDILLNVKAIHLRSLTNRPGKLRLEVQGEGEVCAGDIMTSSDFEIVNPELHIATLDSARAGLMIEMNVEQGKGYEPASKVTGLPIGVLPVDAIFSPVRKVNYTVERTRVGQRTDFERLVLEVWTNGAIGPIEAVRQAGQELVEHFFRFSNLSETPAQDGDKPPWALAIPASQYNMGVESLGLSARTLNCLKRATIHRVGEVLERSRSELLRIRNFGEKSLEELDQQLAEIGIRHPELRSNDEPATEQPTSEGAVMEEVGQKQEPVDASTGLSEAADEE